MQHAAENLAELLDGVLPVSLRHIPLRIRDAARDSNVEAALTGGVPRDLLRVRHKQLHRDQFATGLRDFDVVAAGSTDPAIGGAGIRYAYELARRLPGQLTINKAFHTATLLTADGNRIDITTARREHYASPGMLPEVDIGNASIATDLNRRDFAVNAMALDMTNDYGALIDTCGGVGDILARQIRVLHSASFFDDPTRVMRAIRYSIRLGYDLEPTTVAQLEHAVDEGVFDYLTPERIRHELECIGSEDEWLTMWAALDIFDVTRTLAAGMSGLTDSLNKGDARSLDIAIRNQSDLLQAEDAAPWLIRTAWILGTVPTDELAATANRLGLFRRHIDWLTSSRQILRSEVACLLDDPPARELCRRLEQYPRHAVLLAMFVFQPRTQEEVAARRLLRRYIDEYSAVRCELNGHDLLAMGVRPGPLVGRIRDELRYLRLDGVITSTEEEQRQALEMVRRWVPTGNSQPVSNNGNGSGPADLAEADGQTDSNEDED